MKKYLYLFFTLCLFAVIWQACEKKEENIPSSIYGVVTDKATGEPIQSAQVGLLPGGRQAITGSDGYFEFGDVAEGTYKLSIVKIGYKDYISNDILVKANSKGQSHSLQIEKLPSALTVLDDEGNEVTAIDFGDNPAVVMRSFYIFNRGAEILEWSIAYSCEWISSISKESGELGPNATQPLVVSIDRNKLNVGDNSTSIHIVSNNGTRQIVVSASINSMVETLDATDICASSVVLNGKITRDMSPSINEYGFVYSKRAAPTLENGADKVSFSGTPSIGAVYHTLVTNLDKETTYYARAYVGNGVDVVYGEQVTFVTIEGLPIVKTLGSRDVTSSSAVIQCEAMADAGEPITMRGVCYGKSPQPSINGMHTSDGMGLGQWESVMTDLSPNVTYYVRAYATNSFGTSYGEQLTILTAEGLATVRTGEVSAITSNSAMCVGEVISDGDREVTERGICWKKGAYPTINDSHVSKGTGVGPFSCSLTGLEPGVNYHVRAYAVNSAGTVYGEDVSFMTTATLPEVLITSIINVTSTSAYVYGSVRSTGGGSITEVGFSYKAEGDYYSRDVKTEVSNGTFSTQLTELEPNTTYYIQPYAINSQGTGLGEMVKFRTQSGTPQVSTVSSSNVGATKAMITGKILSDGGFPIEECGICYSPTNKKPTVNDYYVRNTTAQTGQYSCELTDLEPSTRYYACAYVTNVNGTAYGDPISFTTTDGMPSVAILKEPTYVGDDATVYGKILSDGGADIEYYGVLYSLKNTMPSIENHDGRSVQEGNPLTDVITYNLNNIPSGTVVYYRFFVVNSLAKIAYSTTGYVTYF